MKKRLIWLLGIGLTLMIVPFIINKYSIFRVISLVIGVILIEVCFCLKKKRNIFLIVLVPILLFTLSYGVDILLAFKLKYVPIYSYVIKSSDKMKTYNSFFYRVYDCNNNLNLDYGYRNSYVCNNELLDTISINKFLQDPKDSFNEYKNKFVRIHGKISRISGNESIELAAYTKSEEVLNGYVNFNLDYTLNIKTTDDLSKYRIYDYIDVIGRVDLLKDNTITLIDTKLISSDIYNEYSFEIVNNNELKLSNLIKEKGYYYYGINSLNVKYDQDNIYELSYVLQDEKLTFDDLVDDMDFKIISNKDEEEVAKVYNLEKFNVIECSNNKKIVANKNNKVNSDICELVIE